jgi:FixJ family two-component response regulator
MKLEALTLCRNQQCRQQLGKALQEFDIRQQCCPSAQEALELMARGKYSALLLDFDIPGALQLTKLARLGPLDQRPVVFAIIGASTDVGSTFQAGANFVLYKPLENEQLSRSLRAARGFMRPERRRANRQKAETVVYLLYGKEMAVPTLMIDLHEEGLSIQAAQPLPATEEVPIHFLLPGSKQAVEANAELVWADDSGRAGMFFRELSGASKRHLKKWLARANSQKDGVRHDRALSVTAAAAARV